MGWQWFQDRVRPRVVVLRQESCEWTVEDAMAWKAFLATATGRKVMVVANDAAICRRAKVSPDADAQRICYQAGLADGAAGVVELLESLQPAARQRGETDSEEHGETSLLP